MLAILAGCGGGPNPNSATLYPVKGKVLLANGKPLTGGKVIFMFKGEGGLSSYGDIGPDGTFALKTGDREGAIPGDFRVGIQIDPSSLPKTKTGVGLNLKALPFAANYADLEETELTATVKAEPNELPPFKLEPQKPTSAAKKKQNRPTD
jgi:hypothetical protein